MSNEELAVLVQKGNKEYIPELWDNVYRFIYKMCNKYYISHFGICVRVGVELEDITQTSYFALLKAVEAYKPDGEYKFIVYIKYHLKNSLNELLGIRGNTGKRPLNYAVSLETPINDADNVTLADTIDDKTATEAFEGVEQRIYNSELREYINKALSKLPDSQAGAVNAVYLDGVEIKDYAEMIKTTRNYIYQLIKEAFGRLRRDMEFKRNCEAYRADIIDEYGYKSGFGFWKNTGYSSTEKAAEKLIIWHEKHIEWSEKH